MTTNEMKSAAIEKFNNGNCDYRATFTDGNYECMMTLVSSTQLGGRPHYSFNYYLDGKRISVSKLRAIIG